MGEVNLALTGRLPLTRAFIRAAYDAQQTQFCSILLTQLIIVVVLGSHHAWEIQNEGSGLEILAEEPMGRQN